MIAKPPPLAKSLGLLSTPGPARDLWTSAAVRERFTVDALLTDWFTAKGMVNLDDENRAITAALDLKELAVPSLDADGKDALRLAPDLRYQVLQNVGVEAATEALQAIPEQQATGAEMLFKDLLAGQPVKPDNDDRQHLYQLSTVADWAGAVGLPLDFDPQDMRLSMGRRDFIEALGGPDLARFVGREKELGQLRQLWSSNHKSSTALIEAPGGMGKSLLISRFVSDLLQLPPGEAPNAVFHLDFDRRELQTARPATIMAELAKQARRWVSSKRMAMLDGLAQQSSFSPGLESMAIRGSESYSDIGGLCRQLVEILRIEPQSPPRILVVVDSFEQVIGFDDVASYSPAEVCDELVAGGGDVLTIYASRSFPGDRFVPGPNARRIPLTALSVGDATLYIETESRALNRPLSKATVRRILDAVGRSPLALRLAMSLLDKEDDTVDPAQWADGLRDSPERIQAMLHDRILKRLHDENLRKLAMPGLLVRRLSEVVITRILARPCRLDLKQTPPRALMDAAVKEGQLFQRVPSDPGALWHRADVRALMLPDIDAMVPKAVAEQINRAAVDHYSRTDDVLSRTEELYHRLRLDQPAETVMPRWTAEAGKLLRPSLAELPPRARAFVRSALGGASIEAPAQARTIGVVPSPPGPRPLPLIDVEDLKGVVRRHLQRGRFDDVLRTLQEQAVARLDGPLGDIYAETLVALGRQDELIAGVEALQGQVAALRPAVSAGVESAAAGLLEGRRLLPKARYHWEAAGRYTLGPSDDELMLQLSIRIGVLRIHRKLSLTGTRPVERDGACQLAGQLEPQLLERAVVLRETVAELSELWLEPNTPHRSLLMSLFSGLLRLQEAFPSARGDSERTAQLGVELLGQSAESVEQLSAYAEKLAYGSPSELAKLIKVLREEVDRTLERAAVRGQQKAAAAVA